ncbi:MAG: MBL fold metallo-hydrolase [Actinobacteria bacterium]|nr:MBL fold metallo-hydrolase [Actinomycetota bacterium]
MFFKQVKSGGDRNFAYIIASGKTKEAAVIDPSPDAWGVLDIIKRENLKIKYLINTHSHYDHSSGNEDIKKLAGAENINYINCYGSTLKENKVQLHIHDLVVEAIKTPGHTPDSICIKAGDKIVTGDTLFVGKVGGTYSEDDARDEFESLKKLMELPEETEVWPGHDYGVMPHSTIVYEKANNPFIKRLGSFSDFLWLKQNWAQYKIEHGIK